MLELEAVKVRYGNIEAVRGVDLTVAENEVVGIIGANGAGKSSLIHAIFGAVPSIDGTIAFRGQSLVGKAPEDIVRLGLALVPEGRNIFGSLSVRENLRLGFTARSDRVTAAEDLERELERFPILRDRFRMQAGLLSGGEQQMLAIARALLARPRLLVLDEPSLGLAPRLVDEIFASLESLRADGTTILIAEQNAGKTLRFCDRTYVFRQGKVAMVAGQDSDLGRDELVAEYLGGADGTVVA